MNYPPHQPYHYPPPQLPPPPTSVAIARRILKFQGAAGIGLAALLVVGAANSRNNGDVQETETTAALIGQLVALIGLPAFLVTGGGLALFLGGRLLPGRPNARIAALFLEGTAVAFSFLAAIAVAAFAAVADELFFLVLLVPVVIVTFIPGAAMIHLLNPATRAYSQSFPGPYGYGMPPR